MKRAAIYCACLAVAGCSAPFPKTSAAQPATRISPEIETLHGVELVDNYRWLEGNEVDASRSAKVTSAIAAWTDEQSAYARRVLDGLRGRTSLEDQLKPLVDIGALTSPMIRGNRYFFALRTAAERQPTIYRRDGALGVNRVLVDPAKIDPSGLTGVSWFSPSQDGKLLAYGTYREGDQGTTLHLLDVESAMALPIEIGNTTSGPQWLPDGSGFIYEKQVVPTDAAGPQGMFHRVGTEPSADAVVYRQFTKSSLSEDGRWLLLGSWRTGSSNDLWLADFEAFRRLGKLSALTVSVGARGETFGAVVGNILLLQTTNGAPNGRVVSVSTTEPDQSHWRVLVPERPDAAIRAVAFGLGTIAVTYLKNASNVVEVFDLTGRSLGMIKQPGTGTVSLAAMQDRTEAYLTFASFTYPTTVFRVDLMKPTASPTFWMGPAVSIDPSSAEAEQVWYPSKDGTKVSMFLVHRKGLVRTGETPTLLVGHGALGVIMSPSFSPLLYQWFEVGGILAAPNLRGGGEYGDSWHQAAMRGKKQNAIDDFIAAAEWLLANRYTNPQKLAIYGLADGGLVAASALTQRPELFRAAIMADPLIDMLRYEKFVSDPDLVQEYGSAENPTQFRWLLAYSPYQHVRPGTKYPAVLLSAIEGSAGVPALHARKMTAALQAATTSDRSERPILLLMDRPTGNDRSSVSDLDLRAAVDQQIFLMWQLGML